MIIARLWSEADAAAGRYGLLAEGFRALYARILESPQFGQPVQRRWLRDQSFVMLKGYLDTEWTLIENATLAVATEAQGVTLDALNAQTTEALDGRTSDHLAASTHYLYNEIALQAQRDAAHLTQSAQRTAINVTAAARASGMPLPAALIQYRSSGAKEIDFFFKDRRGGLWPSGRFVRTVWRQHLLNIYNDTVAITLSELGVKTARIQHLNPEHALDGQEVALHPGSELPAYSEIQAEFFHPNSNAILGAP